MADIAPLMASRVRGIATEDTVTDELLSDLEAMGLHDFPAVPLVVITGDDNFAGDATAAAAWRSMHAELAALTPRGAQWHARCGHDVPFARPDVVQRARFDTYTTQSLTDGGRVSETGRPRAGHPGQWRHPLSRAAIHQRAQTR